MIIYKVFDDYFVEKEDAIHLLEVKYKSMKELVAIEKKLMIIRPKYRDVNLKKNKITFKELYDSNNVYNGIYKIEKIEVKE